MGGRELLHGLLYPGSRDPLAHLRDKSLQLGLVSVETGLDIREEVRGVLGHTTGQDVARVGVHGHEQLLRPVAGLQDGDGEDDRRAVQGGLHTTQLQPLPDSCLKALVLT